MADQLLPSNIELQQIRDLLDAASSGVEHGVVRGKTPEQHAADLRDSLNWDTAVTTDLHGVYLAGTETVVCHTGNGPHSEANARLITFALNNLRAMVDELERSRSAAQGASVYGGPYQSPVGEMTGAVMCQLPQIATSETQTRLQDNVTVLERVAIKLAEVDHGEPHQLIWQGNPPEPYGEVWTQYTSQARDILMIIDESRIHVSNGDSA